MSIYSALTPSNWLKNVLSKASSSTEMLFPTGKPLYSYQITQVEYENLKTILKITAANLELLKRNTSLAALFVIYCSEWWRRSFQGGAWSWTDLLSEVNMSHAEECKPLLYEVTEKGLFFWKRPILRSSAGRREFLGTFSSEGGLPINQLSNSNNWIERVLTSVLEKYIRFGTDLNQIIENRFAVVNVPATFRDENSSLKETLASIVEAVYKLNIKYKLAEKTNPNAYLNDVEPSWRDQFPIPMDSEQGRLLLESLIKNASQTISKRQEQKAIFRLNRIARILDDELSFEAFLETPPKLTLDFSQTQQVKSFKNNNPLAIDIEVTLPNKQRKIIARGRLITSIDNECYEYELQPLNELLISDTHIATGAFSLFLRFRNQERIAYTLEASYELDFSEPMLFEYAIASGERMTEKQSFQLLAFAESLNIKEERALLFVPKGSDSVDRSNTQFYFPRFELDQGQIVEFSGEISVRTDATYRYRTKNIDTTYQFELDGHLVEYAKNPSRVFKGMPSVFQINTETGHKSKLNLNCYKIKVRLYGESASWFVPSSQLVGCYDLAIFGEQDQLLFKRRVGIVPNNFSMTLVPGKNLKLGQLSISGLRGNFAADENVLLDQQAPLSSGSNHDESIIDLVSVKEVPNEMFELFVKPIYREKDLTFLLSFPALGARLFSPSGDVLSSSSHTLLLNELHGYRLKVFRSKHRDVSVVFHLKDSGLNSSRQDYEIERRYRFDCPKTLLMMFNVLDWEDDIRNLLKNGISIDAHVVIELSMNHDRLCRLEVRNYLTELERDHERQFVLLKNPSLKDFDDLKMEAFRLDAPEKKPIVLIQRQENSILYPMWDVSPLYKKDADWMILTQESDMHLRPMLWSTHLPSFYVEEQASTLRAVSRVSNRTQRLTAYERILSNMAEDVDHKDWNYLRDFNKCTEGQPVEAFDLYRAISQHSLFLASLCFQEEFHGLLKQIQQSLSVNWYLVNFKTWKVAYLAVIKSIEQKIGIEDSDFIKSIMKKQIDSLLNTGFTKINLSSLESVKESLAGKVLPISYEVFRLSIKPNKDMFLQRCAEEIFPEALSGTISWYVEKYKLHDLQGEIQSKNPAYRLPVLMMPIVLAHNAIHESELSLKPSQRFELQKVIDFDREWFKTAFNLAFGYFRFQKMEVAA